MHTLNNMTLQAINFTSVKCSFISSTGTVSGAILTKKIMCNKELEKKLTRKLLGCLIRKKN